MRYIKTFESSGDEMDFDTFKEVMLDVSDMVYDSVFIDYSNQDHKLADRFYSCELKFLFENLFIDVDEHIDGSFIPHAEEPEDIKTAKDIIKDRISEIEDHLYSVKNKVDTSIKTNKDVLGVIEHIDKYIAPRFESFSNYKACLIGIDYVGKDIVVTVTFEII